MWRELPSRLVGEIAYAGECVEIFPATTKSWVQGVDKLACLSFIGLVAATNDTTVCDEAVPNDALSE